MRYEQGSVSVVTPNKHRVQAIRSAEALGVWGRANSEMFSEQHRGDFHEAVPNPGASPQPVTLPLPFLT